MAVKISNIRLWRLQKGLLLRDVAKRTKYGKSQIADVETGRARASDDLCRELARVLDKPIRDVRAANEEILNARKAS